MQLPLVPCEHSAHHFFKILNFFFGKRFYSQLHNINYYVNEG